MFTLAGIRSSYTVPYSAADKEPFAGWRKECRAEREEGAQREGAKVAEFEALSASQGVPVRSLPPVGELAAEKKWPAPYVVRARSEPPSKLALFDPEEGRCRFQIQVVRRGREEAYDFTAAFACPWGEDGPDGSFDVLARPVGTFKGQTDTGDEVTVPKFEVIAILNGGVLAKKQ